MVDGTNMAKTEPEELNFESTTDAARRYLDRGFSVIPLQRGGKRPVIKWAEFQTRFATDAELHEWFDGTGNNIGIVTGAISQLSVVDCDNDEAVKLARDRGIPPCLTAKTGRGFHFYFKDSGAGNFQKRADLPGIDFRGEGGYVVCPPSIHENGTQYRWWGATDVALSSLPTWVIQPQKIATTSETYAPKAEGSRNMALAKLAGTWAIHLEFPEAFQMAEAWNGRNNPPMPSDEVRRTVESVFRRELAQHPERHQAEEQPTRLPAADVVAPEDLLGPLETLYENGMESGESPGWASLARHWTLRKGEWTLVTGIPSHGKSSFLDAVMVNLSARSGWKWAVFSAENLPHELHVANLAEQYIGKPFASGFNERISREELKTATDFISDHFRFIAPPEDEETVSRIVETAEHLHETWGLDGVVLDPWNELSTTHGQRTTETEYVSQALKKIRRFAARANVHVLVVAHPMKLQKGQDGKYPVPTPYDVSGSAHFRNKADCALCVWRDENQPGETIIYVQKIRRRFVGSVGHVPLQYDAVSGQFSEAQSPSMGGF